jgi:hypothetical protein
LVGVTIQQTLDLSQGQGFVNYSPTVPRFQAWEGKMRVKTKRASVQRWCDEKPSPVRNLHIVIFEEEVREATAAMHYVFIAFSPL